MCPMSISAQGWYRPSCMVQTFGQQSRNGLCCVYSGRYHWGVFLYCVSIAVDAFVRWGSSCILELFRVWE